MDENEIARAAYQCALRVHRRLGPGLFESVYEECLAYELMRSGLFFERQKGLPVIYDDIHPERYASGSDHHVPEVVRLSAGITHQLQRGSTERWRSSRRQ